MQSDLLREIIKFVSRGSIQEHICLRVQVALGLPNTYQGKKALQTFLGA